MPLDEGETLSRSIQQVRKASWDVTNAMSDLGTVRDTAAREKLRKARLLVSQCEGKVASALEGMSSGELEDMRSQYNVVRIEFENCNKEALRKEKQTRRSSAHASPPEGAGSLSQYSNVRVQEIKKIDMAEFHTEEALQQEKLVDVREIESSMIELKSTYQEFHDLLQHQQPALDKITGNVGESQAFVENGTTELKHASRRQRCGRKLLCVIALVVVIVLVAIIVLIFVLKR